MNLSAEEEEIISQKIFEATSMSSGSIKVNQITRADRRRSESYELLVTLSPDPNSQHAETVYEYSTGKSSLDGARHHYSHI